MPSGANYVSNPGYEPVQARTISTYNSSIPSGHVAVQGWYYYHNDGGFTGNGWFTNVESGPTYRYLMEVLKPTTGDLEAAMRSHYIEQNGNLTAMFNWWQNHFTNQGALDFQNEVNSKDPTFLCMTLVGPEP